MSKDNWKYIDVATLDFEDRKTWDLICSGKTDGLFQLGSAGMKETCRRIQPRCMDDLVDILALYRTDTLPALEHYILRRQGIEAITYWHDDFIPILKSTYGMIIYQEQVMKITKVFGGFSDGEADKFRKGIGKKDKGLVKEQAEKLRVRTIKNGYSEDLAKTISDYLAEMGGYMFNKGHSAGYAITSYKTAYLKANYPSKFMSSLISNQRKQNGSTDYEKIGLYVLKAKDMGITVRNPDINKSDARFTEIDGDILFGLNLVKGVGNTPVETIKRLRPFDDFEHFLSKTEAVGSINKTVIVALIKAGAFDYTNESRKDLLKRYGQYRYERGLDAIKPIKNINIKHIDKLLSRGEITHAQSTDRVYCLEVWNETRKEEYEENWNKNEMIGSILQWEFEVLSYHLSGDPFKDVKLPPWNDYKDGNSRVKICGTIVKSKKIKVKRGRQKGKTMAFINVDTPEGMREVTVFADYWERLQDRLETGSMVIIRGKKEGDNLLLNGVKTLEQFKKTEMGK